MLKNIRGGVFLVVILVGLCVWAATELKPQLGIDLQGGTELTYRVGLATDAGTAIRYRSGTSTPAEDAKRVIENRLNAQGVKDISVSVLDRNRLLVEIPGSSTEDLALTRKRIEEAGKLTFHLMSDSAEQTPEKVAQWTAAYATYLDQLRDFEQGELQTAPVEPEKLAIYFQEKSKDRTTNVGEPQPFVVENVDGSRVSGEDLENCSVGSDESGYPRIQFTFTGAGAQKFAALTGDNVGQSLAINLDGNCVSRPARINSRIVGDGVIEGSFNEQEVRAVVDILNAGSLPAKLILEQQQTIGSVLGRESVSRGLQAMIAGLVLVIVFMLVYYMAGGVCANLAMAINLLLIFATLVVFRSTLTFPGLAGLLLTIGMTVDANILIFERIREEKNRGRSLNQAITVGYQRAFSTIFDANLTTLLTAFILYQFGTGQVKGFAVVLSIGIIMSFFTAVYVSRVFLSILLKAGLVTEMKMMQFAQEPKFDFFSLQKPARMFSIVMITLGLACLLLRGPDALGLDFTGGARLVVNMKQPVSEAELKDTLKALEDADGNPMFDNVVPQAIGSRIDDGYGSYSVRLRGAALREDTDGTLEGGKSVAEGYRDKVEEVFTTKGWLAPNAIASQSTDATGVMTTVVNLKVRPDQTMSALENVFRDAGFPIATVSKVGTTAPGALYEQVQITTTALVDPAATTDIEKQLSNILRDSPEITAADPFAAVDTISGKVAENLQGKIFVAMMMAFLGIIFYVSLRFQVKFGLAAIVALTHDIFFTLGFMAMADLLLGSFLNLKIDLAVMAALLTVIGYSLNDTIVIFDRIRENLEGKKRDVDYKGVINMSINQTLRRTILTSATTFCVVTILLVWGGESLQGFAMALVCGVVIGTYSSMYVASPALLHFHQKSEARREMILKEAATASK
ncbi:MAG: protein translocase subunit SecD [Planctomycetota bacterium]